MYQEANALLDRGRRFRTQDWAIPFFMGFNFFYFLHDPVQAVVYLKESSERLGSSPAVGLLAARLASRSGETETAIHLLQQLELQTQDPGVKKLIQDRIGTLDGIWVLERAVEHFQRQFGRSPEDLQALVKKGLFEQLPTDPYGGTFYLDDQGKVWTTSDLRPVKKTELQRRNHEGAIP